MGFLNAVSAIAEEEGHHPDLHLTGWRNPKPNPKPKPNPNQDLFNHSPSFAPLAGRILSTAYTLLGRDAFARIAALHAKHRAA